MARQQMRSHLTCAVLLFVSSNFLLNGCGDGEKGLPNSHDGTGIGGQSSSTEPGIAGTAGSNSGDVGGAAGTAGSSLGAAGLGSGVAGAGNRLATPITPDSLLSVDRGSNAVGIQGTWAPTTVGTDSTVTVTSSDGKLCMAGSTALVAQLTDTTWDYANYPGVIVSLDLCRSGAADTPPDVTYPLGSCPWAPNLAKEVKGFRFTMAQSSVLPRQLRVIFKETGRANPTYITLVGTDGTLTAGGQIEALLSAASDPANSSAPPIDPSKLESIQIYAYPSRQKAWPFDFCIDKLEILTGAGWGALPDWISEEPAPGLKVELAGVNLASAEFGEQNLPGVYNKDYVYPGTADVDIYAKLHMNVIRLPFRWERLQQTLGAELDPVELGRLKTIVQYANDLGISVILDPHNYGRYTVGTTAGIIGTDVEIAAFADFWSRLAAIYAANPKVIFGLMNEPHDMPSTESWLSAANAAIAAIRTAGAQNLVLVPGNGWTGAHSWANSYYGTPNSNVMQGVVDPSNNFAFELHQYLDSDSSGTKAPCVSETIGVERVQQVTEWLRTNHFRGFLGEFNGGANDVCYRAIDGLVSYLGQNADVWTGWAVWAGGPWWGENILTVQPRADGRERPQMTVLRRHLPTQ